MPPTDNKMPPDDWRRLDQDEYLKGVRVMATNYVMHDPQSDHEHCEFCGAKFSTYEGDLHAGYCTLDRYRWICPTCFEDFKDEFGWTIVSQ